MSISSAKVVGRVEPGRGLDWTAALSAPASVAAILLDFQLISARALGVPADRIRLHRKPGTSEKAARAPGHWHRDTYGTAAHAICVVGERPTEFLLGEIPVTHVGPYADLSGLETVLKRWQPEVGDVVLIDVHTIHRRPVLGNGPRIFLLAEPMAAPRAPALGA